MGAAGRDFHNFNVFFRDKKEYCHRKENAEKAHEKR